MLETPIEISEIIFELDNDLATSGLRLGTHRVIAATRNAQGRLRLYAGCLAIP